jgi:hypothetical protein
MSTRYVRLIAVASLAMASPLLAQRRAATVARITPYVGYLAFGNIAEGPIGTRVSNANSALYGVELGLDLMPNLSLVGNIGYTDSNVKVGIPIIGGLTIADSKVLLYDGGLQLRLPSMSSLGAGLSPFIEGGAGAMRYEVRSGPLTTQATNFAANFGGGLDLQMNKSIGVRLQAKDYVGKFDLKQATSFNIDSKVAHNLAFTVGLNLAF